MRWSVHAVAIGLSVTTLSRTGFSVDALLQKPRLGPRGSRRISLRHARSPPTRGLSGGPEGWVFAVTSGNRSGAFSVPELYPFQDTAARCVGSGSLYWPVIVFWKPWVAGLPAWWRSPSGCLAGRPQWIAHLSSRGLGCLVRCVPPPGRSLQKSLSGRSRQGRWAHNLWED